MLHLLIASLILCTIGYFLDKLPNIIEKDLSDSTLSFFYHTTNLCIELSFQGFILFVIEVLLAQTTSFSLYELWTSLPEHTYLLDGYLIFCVYKKFKRHKRMKSFENITSIRHKAIEPEQRLNYYLIHYETQLEITKNYLSLLKGFSPIPLALLLFNNFADISFTNFDIESFISTNMANIVIIAITGLYTYAIIKLARQQKQILLDIALIKQELYHCNKPNLYKDKIKSKSQFH